MKTIYYKGLNMHKRRVVLISGCSSGFGMLTTVEMVRRGFLVIATMRNFEKRYHLEEALSKLNFTSVEENVSPSNIHLESSSFINTPHPLCKILKLDVTNLDSVQNCVRTVIENFGYINVLINNAGSGDGGFAEDFSLEEFRAQFDTNFFGLVSLTKAVIPHMRTIRQGHIINISSIAGKMGVPGLSSYCASKFAVEGFSESLRYELRPYNVWVSLVEPGTYNTGIHTNIEQLVTSAYKPKSAYYEWGKRLLDETLKQAQPTTDNPTEVAKLISNIAETKIPKLRYIIGQEVKYLFLKKLIPAFLFERVICWLSGYRYEEINSTKCLL